MSRFADDEARQAAYVRHAAWKRRKAAERRADEAGRLVLCPVCDRWFDNWLAQALHENQAHRPVAS